MPNLYIIDQIKRNTNSVVDCIGRTITRAWDCINKYSTKFANGFNKQIVGRITKVANKHKKCFKIFFSILAVLALITGLFMGSFKSAGSRQQGLQFNYSQQVLKQTYYTNDWKYTGLNGYMEVIPKQKILIQYSKSRTIPQQQQKTNQIYEAIQARVIQGTKIIIQAALQCNILIIDNKNTNMKAFFDLFGFNKTPGKQSQLQWMTYLKQKIINLIIQTVSKQSFYSITNKNLRDSINLQFAQLYENFNSTFPFKISLLTLTINYPQNSFSVNNTLGIQLLKAKSLLNQLNNQYQTVQAYISNNAALINQTYVKNANLSAGIDSSLLNIYSYDGWIKGLDMVKTITSQSTWPNAGTVNSTNMQKFMWLYFNNLYNSTYRSQKMKSQINQSSYQRNMYLQQLLSLY